MQPLRRKVKVGFAWKGSSATPKGGRGVSYENHGSQSAKHVLPMHNFTHLGNDVLKPEVSLVASQPRTGGTAFLSRQKTNLVGHYEDMNAISEVRAHSWKSELISLSTIL